MSDLGASSLVRQHVDFRRLPWIRPLVTAYMHDYAAVAPVFAGNPREPAAWQAAIGRALDASCDRQTLAALLTAQLERRGAAPEARRATALLGETGTVAVLTGQQAGVFGGPLYTLLKAVTAIQLARDVTARYGTPAVPVFWVAGDDHDWAEVRTAKVLDSTEVVRTITLDDLPGGGSRPVAALRFDGRIDDTVRALESALAPSDFRADLVKGIASRYRAGAGVAEAFAGFLDDLLSRHGLVVFEGDDPAAKPLAAGLFTHELADPSRTRDLVRQGADALTRLGHAPQVVPADDSVALFYIDETARHAIRRHEHGFLVGSRPRAAADLQVEAAIHPERFSPNVLLRPLVQDRLFPNICYVGGPAELAYQAELGELYAEFRVARPLLYPRASATILDSAAARFLERHDVAFEALHAQDESALNAWLARQLPAALEAGLEDTSRLVTERLAAIRDTVASVDPTLRGAADTTRDRMLEALRHLHGKVVQASKRKDDTLRRQFFHARALAFPEGHPQERTLALPFFLNQSGPTLIEWLISTLPADTGRHCVIVR